MAKQISISHNRDHVVDYLIPIIRRIRAGENHTEVINDIARTLGVDSGTVYDRCRRGIGLASIRDFLNLVNTGRINAHLLNWFPDRVTLINNQL